MTDEPVEAEGPAPVNQGIFIMTGRLEADRLTPDPAAEAEVNKRLAEQAGTSTAPEEGEPSGQ